MITVTLPEYKTFASITGDKRNDQIVSLLQEASDICENYLGFKYEQPIPEETLILSEGRSVYYPVAVGKPETVHYRSKVSGTEELLVELTDYIIATDGSVHLLTKAPRDYDVLLLAYSNTLVSAPKDVKLAVCLLTQYYYKAEYGSTSTQVAGQTTKREASDSASLPSRVRALLDFHRVL